MDDVKQGIVASKIAAHAADIAKGIPHARDIDDKMGDARRVLDWDAQFACALDPETAKVSGMPACLRMTTATPAPCAASSAPSAA